jgi:hypothetical protein
MCSSLLPIIERPGKSRTIPSFSLFSEMRLGQSTVAIFLAAHLLKNLQLIETARVSLLKTVYLLSPLTSDSTLHMLCYGLTRVC